MVGLGLNFVNILQCLVLIIKVILLIVFIIPGALKNVLTRTRSSLWQACLVDDRVLVLLLNYFAAFCIRTFVNLEDVFLNIKGLLRSLIIQFITISTFYRLIFKIILFFAFRTVIYKIISQRVEQIRLVTEFFDIGHEFAKFINTRNSIKFWIDQFRSIEICVNF